MQCPILDAIVPDISDEQARGLILDAIATEKPFAFTRFGDGEAIILQSIQGRPPVKPETMKAYICKIVRRWGTRPGFQALWQMAQPIVEGLRESDLIGVQATTGIPTFYTAFQSKLIPACSSRIIYPVADPKSLDSFFQEKDVRLFTNHSQDLYNRIQPLTKSRIKVTTIPFETPLQNIFKIIDTVGDFPEPLVLWGFGGGGKNIGVYLRDKFGKTCIDVGSVLDAWSGKTTRKSHKQDLKHLVI